MNKPTFRSKLHYLNAVQGQLNNVKNGYRPGGKAPIGYLLSHQIVGVRNYTPVEKSKLVPDPDWFFLIQRYLKGRVRGFSRKALLERLQLDIKYGSLSSIEFAALTYAGCTVYGRHGATSDGKYLTGTKYRPIDQWAITENTHQAMITMDEAYLLLAALKTRQRSNYKSRYLLTPQLVCECGAGIAGDSNYYRCRDNCGRPSVRYEALDDKVLGKLQELCDQSAFVRQLIATIDQRLRDHKQVLESILINYHEQMRKLRLEIDRTQEILPLTDAESTRSRLTEILEEDTHNYQLLSKTLEKLKRQLAEFPEIPDHLAAKRFLRGFFRDKNKNLEAMKALSRIVNPTMMLEDCYYQDAPFQWED